MLLGYGINLVARLVVNRVPPLIISSLENALKDLPRTKKEIKRKNYEVRLLEISTRGPVFYVYGRPIIIKPYQSEQERIIVEKVKKLNVGPETFELGKSWMAEEQAFTDTNKDKVQEAWELGRIFGRLHLNDIVYADKINRHLMKPRRQEYGEEKILIDFGKAKILSEIEEVELDLSRVEEYLRPRIFDEVFVPTYKGVIGHR